jgi:HD-like signal output (HDOD) protein
MTNIENPGVDALFDKASSLPSVPKVVEELIESFHNDGVSIDEIAGKISADQVLSAKLLRLANSAYYHVSREIGTVNDAVGMLGFVTVRTLVISSGLTGSFKSMPGINLPKFWMNSLLVACLAKHLAKEAHLNRDLAFTVGMMHGIGQLLMRLSMPEEMLEIDKISDVMDPRRHEAERDTFGFDYAEAGAGLATHWRFPSTICTAIRRAPEPLAEETLDPMACLIHLAAWRVRAEDNQLSADEISAAWPDAVAKMISLDRDDILNNMPPLAELTAGMEALIS